MVDQWVKQVQAMVVPEQVIKHMHQNTEHLKQLVQTGVEDVQQMAALNWKHIQEMAGVRGTDALMEWMQKSSQEQIAFLNEKFVRNANMLQEQVQKMQEDLNENAKQAHEQAHNAIKKSVEVGREVFEGAVSSKGSKRTSSTK